MTGVMVICLFLIGAKFLVSPRGKEPHESDIVRRPHFGLVILMGCVVGFLMGSMGGGGGVFIGAAFILLFRMDAKTAIGTSILIMGLAAIPGVVSHWLSGTIQIAYALVILASSSITIIFSSLFLSATSKSFGS